MRRSLSSSQRTSVAPLVQELDEGLLEVEPGRAGGLLELARRAVEHALPVGQHDQLVGVAVGLRDVVGRVDDRRALAAPGAG